MTEIIRCGWTGLTALMQQYHDEEWGVPVHNDRKHFEFLLLEGAQAGLSWETVLKKREGYRAAFAQFDPEQVARFDQDQLDRLLQNPGIIRNRLKVQGAVINAREFLAAQREFGSFDAYIWSFVGGQPLQHGIATLSEVPSTTPESDALSRDLRKRGFKFVGSTIMYAHMQAAGLVNDHTIDCFRHAQVQSIKA
ncbi:MAG: DNA-3-methyladenine glycosylase I [Chloroflexota bacterium]